MKTKKELENLIELELQKTHKYGNIFNKIDAEKLSSILLLLLRNFISQKESIARRKSEIDWVAVLIQIYFV